MSNKQSNIAPSRQQNRKNGSFIDEIIESDRGNIAPIIDFMRLLPSLLPSLSRKGLVIIKLCDKKHKSPQETSAYKVVSCFVISLKLIWV